MKKKKIMIAVMTIIILILGMITIILINRKDTNKVAIFTHSHENNAWSPVSYGYTIYDDGTIKEYDNYNTDKELKIAKITDDELIQLKDLANLVDVKYTSGVNPESILNPNSFASGMISMFDAGVTEKKIYNSKDKKWITLYKFGDTMGYNNTEETKEIIELTDLLYEKYIK